MPLELWGGCECTVNRVGDRTFDQTIRTGRQHRLTDLAMFADLGIKALRHPILWERTAPDHPQARDFAWTDVQLAEMRRLDLRPIAGLVHHGSGPRYTNLLDAGFASGLAAHARAVAERYPWIEDWTPVNEPLTTARFSCLYGHWYPHRTDDGASVEALLNQIDAVRLSMAEIRKVNPAARLVQTEDLGFVHSTRALADQALFENERRWLTWDLLCGRVTPDHPIHGWLAGFGFADRLKAIADDPCPPDVIGVNHYLTSERFLDERIERYPDAPVGGNGRQRYVDVEAVRVAEEGPLGLRAMLSQAWSRYGRTLAVTEIHNGCTREEQMRWFLEAWSACQALRDEGVDIRAATAWSLLGAYDWPSLLTREDNVYECGVFDLRSGAPRPTAMAGMLKALAKGETPDAHALALTRPGWWRRSDIRYRFDPAAAVNATERKPSPAPLLSSPPLLIAGEGLLARVVARCCRYRDLPFMRLQDHPDLRDFDEAIERLGPAAVIDVSQDAGFAARARRHGVAQLAFTARPDGARLTVVFEHPFCHEDEESFAMRVLASLRDGRPVLAADDLAATPTYRPASVDAALDLLLDGASGVWRVKGADTLSWAEFGRRVARVTGFDPDLVRPASAESLGLADEAFAPAAFDERYDLPPLDRLLERFRDDEREGRPQVLMYAAE